MASPTSTQSKARFHGIYCPNIVPLDEKGEINEAELRRYIDWLIGHGVHGLYPNGSTGEFTRFTAATTCNPERSGSRKSDMTISTSGLAAAMPSLPLLAVSTV